MRCLKSILWALLAACLLNAPSHAQGTGVCPKALGWKPTEQRLTDILKDHKVWLSRKGWRDTAVPGKAILCGAKLSGAKLSGANLVRADLRNAVLVSLDLSKIDLSKADLRKAHLDGANLGKATLIDANLIGADLTGADLREAALTSADLSGADLTGADLREAKLRGADLTRADLTGAKLDSAEFADVNLTKAIYQPASAPAAGYLSGLTDLVTVQFDPGEYSGLVHLRTALQEAGLRELEREATFALESGRTRHLLADYSVEGALRLVFFQWTTGYGLYPGRAILILFGLAGFMTLVYLPVVAMPGRVGKRNGIFRIWPRGRIRAIGKSFEAAEDERIERLDVKGPAVLGYALYFSLLSAFQIGWRDLNVGGWLARLQAREYALRARGWVRVASGAQSLASVYLLAMWALTYFGRPFQ